LHGHKRRPRRDDEAEALLTARGHSVHGVVRGAAERRSSIAVRWPSEREVADEVPIDIDVHQATRVLTSVPLWFHTFALSRKQGLYTPGKARDHGYRLASIPDSFIGASVLDVGAFDGFYSFMAEKRGASRVLAIDNEQYVHWVRDRWGIELTGGEGFRAIHRSLGSKVEYRCMDALEIADTDERFDFIFCFGILHRVENPLGLLRTLAGVLSRGGQILIETYGILDDAQGEDGAVRIPNSGDVYTNDHFVYWQFSASAISNLAAFAGGLRFDVHALPLVDGHPRIIGAISSPRPPTQIAAATSDTGK
jgi:tRNA (mo5U34)-methyltransferase